MSKSETRIVYVPCIPYESPYSEQKAIATIDIVFNENLLKSTFNCFYYSGFGRVLDIKTVESETTIRIASQRIFNKNQIIRNDRCDQLNFLYYLNKNDCKFDDPNAPKLIKTLYYDKNFKEEYKILDENSSLKSLNLYFYKHKIVYFQDLGDSYGVLNVYQKDDWRTTSYFDEFRSLKVNKTYSKKLKVVKEIDIENHIIEEEEE